MAKQDNSIGTATDFIAQQIQELIVKHELPPGTRLKNNELAERFGMSVTPVREALSRLEKMGLVEYQARKGWEVKAIDTADLKDAYDLRECLERLAVRTLTKRYKPGLLTPLYVLLDEYKELLEAGNDEKCVKADLDFHSELIRLTGNQYAISTMSQLLNIIYLGRSMENYEENNITCYGEHKAILDAIAAGDAAAAEAGVEHHLSNCLPWF